MAKLYLYKPGENRLVYLDLGKLFSWSPKSRAELLNDTKESTEHNEEMLAATEKEFNDAPLADSIKNIKSSAIDIKDKAVSVFKEVIKSPFKLAAHAIAKPVEWIGKPALSIASGALKSATAITTNIAGVVSTAPRIAADAARLAARVPLVALDKLSVVTGYPSRLIDYIKKEILGVIENTKEGIEKISSDTREKIFATLGTTA